MPINVYFKKTYTFLEEHGIENGILKYIDYAKQVTYMCFQVYMNLHNFV